MIYFVCTNQKEVYIIDISRVMAGNMTAYKVIESPEEICTDVTCSPMQYIGPLLFVPLRSNGLAMYTLDPIKLHVTLDILTDQYYRYFFTYTTLVTKPKSSIPLTNDTVEFDATSSEPSKSSGLNAGLIAGIAVIVFVVILIVLILTTTLFYRYKNRISRLVVSCCYSKCIAMRAHVHTHTHACTHTHTCMHTSYDCVNLMIYGLVLSGTINTKLLRSDLRTTKEKELSLFLAALIILYGSSGIIVNPPQRKVVCQL